jgi:hypothetical protein
MDQEMKRLRFSGNENITRIAKVEVPNVEELNTSVEDIITCFLNFWQTSPAFQWTIVVQKL